jgi:hypothetical protein
MSHFAKVVDGKVVNVIVAEQEFFDTFVDSSPGTWLQTSYNTHGNQHPEGRPLRGNYAGLGYTYDATNDVFYAPKPFNSWLLNEDTCQWQSPIPYPTTNTKGLYIWNEETQSWELQNYIV